MFDIIYSDTARKELKKLPQEIQLRIIDALERIMVRPESFVTKLVGDPGFRFRVGDYRIILDLEYDQLIVLVIKIGHRRNIYDH